MTRKLPQCNPSILQIAPYVGGKSASGAARTIKLSSNETPLGPSPAAIEAYNNAVSSLHRYPDGSAHALREAIAEVHKLEADRIVCGAGSDELIGLLVHAYAMPGDEVLYSAHGFLMYKIYAQGSGAVPVDAPEKNVTADVDALLAAVTPRTKIVFLANPNNPTGSLLSQTEVERLHRGLPSDVILALDAAYAEYVTDPHYNAGEKLVLSNDNVVMLRTFSKIYGLSSLRLGWGFFPPHIADVLNRLRGPFNVSTPAAYAGIAAVKDQAFIAHARDHNTVWLGWLRTELESLGFKTYPSHGNFLMVNFGSPEKTKAVNAFLMERGLIIRDISSYGLSGHMRITIGTEEENKLLVNTLKDFLKA